MKRFSGDLPGPTRDCGQMTGHVIVGEAKPNSNSSAARPETLICQRKADMGHGICGPPAQKKGGVGHPIQKCIVS